MITAEFDTSKTCTPKLLQGAFCASLIVFGFNCQATAAHGNTEHLTGFHHSAWGAESGIGAVYNEQQDTHGFLWLTTSVGVFRFDGVSFDPIEKVTNGAVSNADLDSVFVAQNGDLWLATRTLGVLRWENGKLENFPDRRCSPAMKTDSVVEAEDGTLWIQSSAGLAHLSSSGCEVMGAAENYAGGWVSGLLIDHRGTLWVQTVNGSVLTLPKGQHRFAKIVQAVPAFTSAHLRESPSGEVWTCDGSGMHPILLPPHGGHDLRDQNPAGDFVFAPDGTLWASSTDGLTRYTSPLPRTLVEGVARNHSAHFGKKDGLSSTAVWKLFVDREGGIWVGSTAGLDYLRPAPLHSLSMLSGDDLQLGVAPARGGGVFVGNQAMPLVRLNDDGVTATYPVRTHTTALRTDWEGHLWIGGPGHLGRMVNGFYKPFHYPFEQAAPVTGIAVDPKGDLWVLLLGGITFRFHEGRWERQDELLKRKPGVLGTMRGDAQGNVWFAYSDRLTRWDGYKFDFYTFKGRHLRLSVYTLFPAGDHAWMGGGGGLLFFSHGTFRTLDFADQKQPGRVTGVLETVSGDLWINGYSGVTHVSAKELSTWRSTPSYRVVAESLDNLDGLEGLPSDRTPEPSLVQATDGKLWFATSRAVAWLDPRIPLPHNSIVPEAQITAVSVDGKLHPQFNDLEFGPRLDSLRIAFTAPSLLIPERVRFQYKLGEGDDPWVNAGWQREASLAHLKPGHYDFLVRASNDGHVWSEVPARVSFYVRPAWYQTWWFVCLGLASLLISVWWAFHLRTLRMIEQASMRLEDRTNERVRIARELHDTLLQSFFGIMMQFQSVKQRLPIEEPMRDEIECVLKNADAVLRDGRERVKNLRGLPGAARGLVASLQSTGNELQSATGVAFELVLKGNRRPLTPLAEEEISFIGHEAITNAFRHARARNIRVEVEYGVSWLNLSILDDGVGIDGSILRQPAATDHWGLVGMRERADRVGAELVIAKAEPTGTRISIRLRRKIAYQLGRSVQEES